MDDMIRPTTAPAQPTRKRVKPAAALRHITVAFTALLFVFAAPLIAQAQLTVCVVDEVDNAPIPGAYVQHVRNGASVALVTTDQSGCTTLSAIGTSTEEGQPIRPHQLSVGASYPNPTGGTVGIDVTLHQAAPIHVGLFDLLGRRVSSGQYEGRAGTTPLWLDLTGQAPGLYFARIQSGGRSQTVQIIKDTSSPAAASSILRSTVDNSLRMHPLHPSGAGLSAGTAQAIDTLHVAHLGTSITGGVSYLGLVHPFETTENTPLQLALTPMPTVAPDSLTGEPGEIFVIVEQMPDLIGGLEGLQARAVYPAEALQNGIEGRVFVQFIVDTEGRPLNPEVVRGLGGGADEEALRLLLTSRFIPGRHQGEPVAVKMSLPITFKLQ